MQLPWLTFRSLPVGYRGRQGGTLRARARRPVRGAQLTYKAIRGGIPEGSEQSSGWHSAPLGSRVYVSPPAMETRRVSKAWGKLPRFRPKQQGSSGGTGAQSTNSDVEAQTWKEEPQPQLPETLGFPNLNPEP